MDKYQQLENKTIDWADIIGGTISLLIVLVIVPAIFFTILSFWLWSAKIILAFFNI